MPIANRNLGFIMSGVAEWLGGAIFSKEHMFLGGFDFSTCYGLPPNSLEQAKSSEK